MSHKDSIKAVFFDVGGVLTVPVRETMEKIATDAPFDVELAGRHFAESFLVGHDGDLPSHRLERGEIDIDEFVSHLGESRDAVRSLLHPESPHSLFANVMPHQGMHRLVDDLRLSGFATGIISNIFNEYVTKWDEITNHADRFDVVIYSCVEGVRKPNRAIFDLALHRSGLKAEEVVFVDDSLNIVNAAADLGFRTVHVLDHNQAIEETRAITGIG